MNSKWVKCSNQLPQEDIKVMTKIDDSDGIKNEQVLKRNGNLWFLPDMSMHVYYTPTHWKEIE